MDLGRILNLLSWMLMVFAISMSIADYVYCPVVKLEPPLENEYSSTTMENNRAYGNNDFIKDKDLYHGSNIPVTNTHRDVAFSTITDTSLQTQIAMRTNFIKLVEVNGRAICPEIDSTNIQNQTFGSSNQISSFLDLSGNSLTNCSTFAYSNSFASHSVAAYLVTNAVVVTNIITITNLVESMSSSLIEHPTRHIIAAAVDMFACYGLGPVVEKNIKRDSNVSPASSPNHGGD